MSNNGLISGNGRLIGTLSNNSTGEVRASTGERLTFSNPTALGGGFNGNSGQINLLGGIVEFGGQLINQSTGRINGRGVLRTGGGVNNSATIAFSADTTDVFGPVINNNPGKIIITGN